MIGVPLGCPSLEVFPASQTGRIPKISCRDHLSFLVRECPRILLEEVERHCRGERDIWYSPLIPLPPRHDAGLSRDNKTEGLILSKLFKM